MIISRMHINILHVHFSVMTNQGGNKLFMIFNINPLRDRGQTFVYEINSRYI